jgi:hypothetical protein
MSAILTSFKLLCLLRVPDPSLSFLICIVVPFLIPFSRGVFNDWGEIFNDFMGLLPHVQLLYPPAPWKMPEVPTLPGEFGE